MGPSWAWGTGSDARLVAVEGRDVEHVAVRAHAHGLHLPVAGQRRRVRGAARAEDLEGEQRAAGPVSWAGPPAAPAPHPFPTSGPQRHVCEGPWDARSDSPRGRGTTSATPPTFPQLRQWCFLRMTVKGALHAVQKPQASSGTHSGGSMTTTGGDTSARGTHAVAAVGTGGWRVCRSLRWGSLPPTPPSGPP